MNSRQNFSFDHTCRAPAYDETGRPFDASRKSGRKVTKTPKAAALEERKQKQRGVKKSGTSAEEDNGNADTSVKQTEGTQDQNVPTENEKNLLFAFAAVDMKSPHDGNSASVPDPTSYRQAHDSKNSDQWKMAEEAELKSLEEVGSGN